MGILSTILGSGDVIKSGMQLIDAMHTSKEEALSAKTQGKVDLLNAYAPFKVAQRYLALMFTFTFLGSFLLVLAMTLFGDVRIHDIRAVIAEFYIGQIMLIIITFYFGGGFLESTKWAKRQKQ